MTRVLTARSDIVLDGEEQSLAAGCTVVVLGTAEGQAVCAASGGRLFRVPEAEVSERFRPVEFPLGGEPEGFAWLAALLFGGAAALQAAEAGAGGTINSFEDALWYGINTISTVGVGDVAPSTEAGRLISSAMMAIGNPLYAQVGNTLITHLLKPAHTAPAHTVPDSESPLF